MNCSNCQTFNADADRWCVNCGAPLGRAADPPAPPATSARDQHATVKDRGRDPLIGSTIDRKYRIDSRLGVGGMGAVYRATRLLIGDEVAVKILHAEQSDPKAAERFQREAQAAARLRHHNAVTIHDFGVTDDGLQYLVMEYVEGQSLRRIIKGQGSMAPAAAAEIIAQVCAALDEAHRQHIVHRDIKPDNIIVSQTADGIRIKVLDFGIAKLRDEVASHLTQTGSVMGTPHYMSPEQCLGEELDSRADIYSLGIVLYEMLCGRVPFNSPVSTAVVIQQVNQPPPSLLEINSRISRQVEAVVFHALEKQREARPATAGALARELAAAVGASSAPTAVLSSWPPAPETSPSTGRETDETVLRKPVGTPSAGMQATVQLPVGSSSGPTPVSWPAVPNYVSSGARSQQNLPWKIGAILFGVLFFGAVIAMITWSLAREQMPDQVTGSVNGNVPSNTRVEKPPVNPTPTPLTDQPLHITMSASSFRAPGKGLTYYPANLINGNLPTAWDEGVYGPGIGEWVKCTFDREVTLNSIKIYPGYFKGAAIWAMNNRLASATLTFSDGTSKRVNFPDLMKPQDVAIGGVRTSSVMLTIDGIYPGNADDLDTPISEVMFDWTN